MMKKFQKGITIVELIVYIGLLSIFMLVLLDVFVTILNSKLESESTSALNQDARYIYSKLSYDVANADSMTLPSTVSPTGSTLTITTSGVTHTYSLDGSGNINLTTGGTTMKLNSIDTNLSNLTFTRLEAPNAKPMVKISYTVNSLIELKSGEATRTIDTTFGLRP
jgi:Tfp pilus assembly protein PilE